MISGTGNRRGISLIEILVSVTILASAVVLVLQALAKGAYALTTATHHFRVYELATQKMADVDLAFLQGTVPTPKGELVIDRDQYHWHLDTAPITDDPQLTSVTLTIGWSQGRRSDEVHVTTLKPVAQPAS